MHNLYVHRHKMPLMKYYSQKIIDLCVQKRYN